MYLSKLEIIGFKSFAQRTVVHFNRGITAIVGPNGCGKTNIVDALRWCLGEQKTSVLRSDKMENVIFNGTAAKKPMGMAEVALTIQNDKGILPTDYSEVIITRRIFRSGESEYLLNKSLARLKDITNLFMDTGMGTNAYSVIELKMVESILSNRTEERRVLFEEAAGVNKYKLRRRLTLKKLDETKADLDRVNDITTEVERKAASLERQAKKADKATLLQKKLEELDKDLAEHEYANYTGRTAALKNSLSEQSEERKALDARLAEAESEISSVKAELGEIDEKLSRQNSAIAKETQKLYKTQQSLSVSEERRLSLEKNIKRYSDEIDELKNRLLDTQQSIEILTVDISRKNEEITGLSAAKEDLRLKVSGKNEERSKKSSALKAFSAEQIESIKQITRKQNEITSLQTKIDSLRTAVSKQENRIQVLTGTIAKTVGFIEELSNEKIANDQKLLDAESHLLRMQANKEQLELNRKLLTDEETAEQRSINDLLSKITFIKTLIQNLEGFSKGTKKLLEDKTWTSGDVTLVAEIGNTSDQYRFAVEAALKQHLNTIIVESIHDIEGAVSFLKSNNSGKALFSMFGSESGDYRSPLSWLDKLRLRRRTKMLKAEEGFLANAADCVETDPKWEQFFARFLNKTIIVDSLAAALRLAKRFPQFNFATLSGDFVSTSGIIEAGAEPGLDDTLFGRKQLLETLSRQLPEHEKRMSHIKSKILRIEEEISSIDLKAISEQIKLLLSDVSNVEKQIAQMEFEKQKAIDDIEKARAEIQDAVQQANSAEAQLAERKTDFESHTAEQQEANALKTSLENELAALESERNSLSAQFNKTNIQLERSLGELKNFENEKQRATESIGIINQTIARREDEIKRAREESESLDILLDNYRFELDELTSALAGLEEVLHKSKEEQKVVRAKLSSLEKAQSADRKLRDDCFSRIHEIEIQIRELSIHRQTLVDKMLEKYNFFLEEKTFEELDLFDFIGRRSEVHALEVQLQNLGPVNLLAYEEYEEVRQRMEFLTTQRNDLIQSEKDLLLTIQEINETAVRLFMETFEKIRSNFISIFRSLFNPGDEADLKLEEDADPLEAKIEIIAKPKGKRPTSIELLSGGEKTLTAIALLFAIYLVKPSPFCILDEIDAPLDDANIDRFTRILAEFSHSTQFIVVTHNKRTMEAADILYGVTMQEEGVSKLVGVKFSDDFNIVA